MSQKPVPLLPERMNHIWTHANGSEDLFRSEENYRYFLKRYAKYIHPIVDTYAYCLMPNHLHFMVRVKEEDEVLKFIRDKKRDPNLQGFQNLGGFSNVISQEFSNLFNSYTKSYNKKYDRKGSPFIPSFKRKLIDSGEYFSRLIAYIHNNPVHHGFVEDADDWPYSSWHAYLYEQRLRSADWKDWYGSVVRKPL